MGILKGFDIATNSFDAKFSFHAVSGCGHSEEAAVSHTRSLSCFCFSPSHPKVHDFRSPAGAVVVVVDAAASSFDRSKP